MTRHRVHKSIDFSKLSPKAKDRVMGELATNYAWSAKYDGVCALLFLDPVANTARAESRTGEPTPSVQTQAEHALSLLRSKAGSEPCVVFAEAWAANMEHSEINGLARRKTQQDALVLVFWDLVPMEHWHAGQCDIAFSDRYLAMHRVFSTHLRDPKKIIFSGLYYEWPRAPHDLAKRMVDQKYGAYDGIVAKRKDAPWKAGPGNADYLKFKPLLSFDLRVLGLDIAARGQFMGDVGALIVSLDGKEFKVGTGLTAQQRAEWRMHPESIVGRVVRVDALARSSKGVLREPRLIAVRHDKETADDEQ